MGRITQPYYLRNKASGVTALDAAGDIFTYGDKLKLTLDSAKAYLYDYTTDEAILQVERLSANRYKFSVHGSHISLEGDINGDYGIMDTNSGDAWFHIHRNGSNDYAAYIKDGGINDRIQLASFKGVANGIIPADAGGLVDISDLPASVKNGIILSTAGLFHDYGNGPLNHGTTWQSLASNPEFLGRAGTVAISETSVSFYTSQTIEAHGIIVNITANTATGNTIIVLREDESDTTVTLTVGAGQTGEKSATGFNESIAAGGLLALKVTPNDNSITISKAAVG